MKPVQPSPDARVVEPCELFRFAEENDLWGAKVRVSGVYVTDHQSFSHLRGDCGSDRFSLVELAHVPDPQPEDLRIRNTAVAKACRGKSFCVYEADVTIEGILVREDKAEFGLLIRPTKYLKWEIHPEP